MKTILRAAMASWVLMVGACSSSSSAIPPAAPGAPGAPTGLQGTRGDGQVQLQWVAPRDNGGAAIIGYTVTVSPGGQKVSAGTTSTASVTGLTNGTSYTFTVTATNGAGTGPASVASAPIVPATVPSLPTAIVASVQGPGEVKVSWSPSDPRGSPVSGYTVTSEVGGLRRVTLDNSLDFTGLSPGVKYTFNVVATNDLGDSEVVQASATTPTLPGAPSGLIGVAYDARLNLSWQGPDENGGLPVTGYTVVVSGDPRGTLTLHSTGPQVGVPMLTNGVAHTYTVTATNAVGDSTRSGVSPAFTPVAPRSTNSTLPADGGSLATASGVVIEVEKDTFAVDTSVTVDETAAAAPDAGVLQASMLYTFDTSGHAVLKPVLLTLPVTSGVSQASLYWETALNDGGTDFERLTGVFDGGSLTTTVPTLTRGFIGSP